MRTLCTQAIGEDDPNAAGEILTAAQAMLERIGWAADGPTPCPSRVMLKTGCCPGLPLGGGQRGGEVMRELKCGIHCALDILSELLKEVTGKDIDLIDQFREMKS